jgi:hypothetical protein
MIVTLSMGIRHGFGLWLQPITQAQGWTARPSPSPSPSRTWPGASSASSPACWPTASAPSGAGRRRVLYALGLVGMALSPNAAVFTLTAGVLIGAAQAGTTYAVVYGVIGRQIDPAKRSWAMGVAAAAGSFGQFLMVPVEGFLIGGFGWQQALLVLAPWCC